MTDLDFSVYYSHPNAKLGQPNEGDAGFDIYAPESFTLPAGKVEINLPFNSEFFQKLMDATDTSEMIIHALTAAGFNATKVPTGIHMRVPNGYIAMAKDRSSMGIKTIHVFAGIIDSSYTGECQIVLVNFTDKPITFEAGSKIAQFLLIPVITPKINVVETLDELGQTERGAGGFGSTDKKV